MRAHCLVIALLFHAGSAAEPVYWSDGNGIQLSVSAGEKTYRVWEITRFADGDRHVVTLDARNGSEIGTVILLRHTFILSRGELLPPDREYASVQEPIQMLSFLLSLLGNFGNGPDNVFQWEIVDWYEPDIPIEATNDFGVKRTLAPPMTINGRLTRRADATYRFEITVQAANEPVPWMFTGVWRLEPVPTSIDDGLDLEGWRVHRLDWTRSMAAVPVVDTPRNIRGLRRQMIEAARRRQ